MTREESWQVEGVTLTILRHITSLGYMVSVFRIPASCWGRNRGREGEKRAVIDQAIGVAGDRHRSIRIQELAMVDAEVLAVAADDDLAGPGARSDALSGARSRSRIQVSRLTIASRSSAK